MKKLCLISLSFILSGPALAVLGPKFPQSQRPHSVCAIEFFAEGTDKVDEICSAVVVGKRQLLTAAHCTPGLPERNHRIFCRDQKSAKIVNLKINSEIDLSRLRFGEEEHRLDTAFLEIDRDIDIPAVSYSQTLAETLEVIQRAQTCGVFGHGGFRQSLRMAGFSTNAIIRPEQIEFEGDLIKIKGYGGYNSGLVEPGDSGGSLACQDELGTWTHLAQVSGRTMSAVSLFAPVYLFAKDLEESGFNDRVDNQSDFGDLLNRWRADDQKNEMDKCLKSHKAFVKEEFVSTSSHKEDIKKCEVQKLSKLESLLEVQEEVILRIRPFSLIELDQKKESLLITHQPSLERILEGKNPFSTVDHEYMQFKVREIDQNYAYGDVNIFGYSESFGCFENILCDGGLYKNIKVKLEDLAYPER